MRRLWLSATQGLLRNIILIATLLAFSLLLKDGESFARNPSNRFMTLLTSRLSHQLKLTPVSAFEAEIQLTPVPDFSTLDQSHSPDANNSTNWQLQSPPHSPSSRAEMGFVYDSHRGVIVAIGGSQRPTRFAETWEYDGNTWVLKPTVHFPSSRNRPAIAYDPVRRVSVLFGGSLPDDTLFFNDTWEYDGIDWIQKIIQNPPSPRNGATMVYDPVRGRMLLFGGYRYENGFRFFNETWEYDGVQWIQLSPANQPSERETAAMVYDSNRNRVILFGGGHHAGSMVFNDTWAWDGTNWTQLSPQESPTARWAHAMTYDQGRQQLVLFGGLTGRTNAFDDTWEFDGDANTWTRITISPSPPKRWDHGMVYDTKRDTTVLFGGMYSDFGFKWRNDTWNYGAQQSETQRPVVLLPGLPGSVLYGKVASKDGCSHLEEQELWVNPGLLARSLGDEHLNRLRLDENGLNPEDSCNEVGAPRILDDYDPLLKFLTNEGYAVFPCSYDWRRSLDSDGNAQNAVLTKVDSCINVAQRGNPNQQVDIVAHSTGGLVARRYVLSDNNPDRAANVHTIVTLGTPYLGTVKPFILMRYGKTLTSACCWDLVQVDWFIEAKRIKEAAPNWPAIYQLLPSRSSFDVFHGYFKKKELGNSNYTEYSIYPLMEQFLIDNYNTILPTIADSFHAGAMDDWRNDRLDVNYYIFVGNKVDTPRWVLEWYANARGRRVLAHDIIFTSGGDGTVPFESARLLGGTRAGDAIICPYDKVDHSKLTQETKVLRALITALRGGNPCPTANQASAASINPLQDSADSRQLVVRGSALVHVRDNQSRHTGPISDTLFIEENIPLVTYLASEDVTFVSLPPISTYTITVKMSDTLPMEVKLRTVVDAETLEEAITQTVIFQNVPSTIGGQATFVYHPLAAPDTLQLMVDLNGDNLNDLSLPPTAILNKQESADYESPVTSIRVQGQKDANGFFTGTVNIALTATDTGSGVQRIEYSIDKGETFHEYTAPLMIVAENVPVLYAQAVDRAGNVEYPFASVTLRPTNDIVPGDCNGDQSVGAADITALALEFFDGDDNNNPADTPNGTYPGNPGCDANEDGRIGASDVTCIALLFFNGPGACTTGVSGVSSASPVLSIPEQLPASPGTRVTVPVTLVHNNSDVSSLLFSLDYDETQLTFDPTDGDHDGIPDAITFNLPSSAVKAVMFEQSDTHGELDFLIADFAASPTALPEGPLAFVTFNTNNPIITSEAAIRFTQYPVASFGDVHGRAISGVTNDGSVLITVATGTPVAQSTIYLPIIIQNHE